MTHRYFLIEPLHSEQDMFCSITMGSSSVRATIQTVIDGCELSEIADDLQVPMARDKYPRPPEERVYPHSCEERFNHSGFEASVVPGINNVSRILKLKIFNGCMNDGAPFFAEVHFELTTDEAEHLSRMIRSWLYKKEHPLVWCS